MRIVSKKLLAKCVVPVNRIAAIAEPEGPLPAWGAAPPDMKPSICCRKVCNVATGWLRNFSRSCKRGMPSGSFVAHSVAGPETAAPMATIAPKKIRIRISAASARGRRTFSSARIPG